MEGGVIVTDSDEIADAIRQEIAGLPQASKTHSLWVLFQLLIYAVFLEPRRYWIPNSLPFLKLGTTEFDPEYPSLQLPRLVLELISRLMPRLEEMNQIRRHNAATLEAALKDCPSYSIPRPPDGCLPNYIRLPIIAKDEVARNRAVRRLQAVGIGAGPMYPGAVCDIEGIGPHMVSKDSHYPAAEGLSRRLLTLPTHPYVTQKDLTKMIDTLRKAALE